MPCLTLQSYCTHSCVNTCELGSYCPDSIQEIFQCNDNLVCKDETENERAFVTSVYQLPGGRGSRMSVSHIVECEIDP